MCIFCRQVFLWAIVTADLSGCNEIISFDLWNQPDHPSHELSVEQKLLEKAWKSNRILRERRGFDVAKNLH